MGSDLRIPGINTGMDTQATIDKIMKYSKAPLDRLKQQQQMLIWKQEAYRAQNTALSQLKDLLFNLKLQKSYNTKSVTSSNSQIVAATVNSTAVNGGYSVKVEQLATAAYNTSASSVSIRSKVTGDSLTTPINITSGNNQINVTVDGETHLITLSDGIYDGTNLDDLAADIESKLNVFATKIYVKVDSDNHLVFYSAQKDNTAPHTIALGAVDSALSSLGFQDQDNSKEIIGNIITSPLTITSSNNRFKITVGSEPAKEITLSTGTYDPAVPAQLTAFASDIQTQINNLGGAYSNIRVSVTSLNQLKIEYNDASNPQSVKLESGSTADVLSKLGFTNGTVSEAPNPLSLTASFWNQKDKFIGGGFFDGKTNTSQFKFAINGHEFTFSCQNSPADVINALKTIGVNAYYDSTTDKFTLTTTQTGDNNPGGKEMLISDPDSFLGSLFNIGESGEKGGDNAIVNINNIQMQSKSNTISYNGITFTLNGVTGAGPNTIINVSADTSGIVKQVQDFVNKYNEVIAGINAKLTETRATSGDKYTFYLPLTDDQKKNLSEDEIKSWEEKAKQGILHNDDILTGALNEMRAGLYRQVDAPRTLTGIGLSGTGIDLAGANRFVITVGRETKEISLTERSYTKDQYADLVKDIQNKLDTAFGYNRVKVSLNGSNALTLTSQNQAMTLGDASANNGLDKLGFYNGANVKTTYNQISQIGITTGSYYENGKLYLNTDTLEAALQNDPDGVIRLLTNNETVSLPDNPTPTDITNAKTLEKNRQGIFYNLFDVLSNQIRKISNEAGSTGTASAGNELGKQLIEIGDRINTTQDRINAEEDRLWNMFSQMEVMIGQMNSQMNWISSMLGQSNQGGSQ